MRSKTSVRTMRYRPAWEERGRWGQALQASPSATPRRQSAKPQWDVGAAPKMRSDGLCAEWRRRGQPAKAR